MLEAFVTSERIPIKPGLINVIELKSNMWAWERRYHWKEKFAEFTHQVTKIIKISPSLAIQLIYIFTWNPKPLVYISYLSFRVIHKLSEKYSLKFRETRRKLIFLGFVYLSVFHSNEIFSAFSKIKNFLWNYFCKNVEYMWLTCYTISTYSLDECWEEGHRPDIKYYSIEQKACEGLPRNWMIQFVISHGSQKVNPTRYFFSSFKAHGYVKNESPDECIIFVYFLASWPFGIWDLSSWRFDSICWKEEIIFEFSLIHN